MRVPIIAAIIASLVLVTAPAANASPRPTAVPFSAVPAAASGKWPGADFRHWARGRHLGPNSDTDWGEIWLRYFDRNLPWTPENWSPVTTVGNGNPGFHSVDPARLGLSPDGKTPVLSWWNPLTWNWGNILGAVWGEMEKCMKGAAAGWMPVVTGTTAVNMLFRAGKVYVGPYGYAAIGVGGCLWAIVS